MSERASLPAIASPEYSEFDAQIRQAQDELTESVERAGLARDPYRFVVGAISHTLGMFPSIVHRLETAVETARQPIDPAAIERLESAAASGAAQRAGELARAHNWRTITIAMAVLVGVAVAGVAGGVWAERRAQLATDAGIAAEAVRQGPSGASEWLVWMQNNDVNELRGACDKSTVLLGGRRACAVGLWLDPPMNPAPPTAPVRK